MSWGIVATVAATAVGAGMQSRAADKATDAQTAAANQEIEFARESRDLARKDQEPYRKAGVTALDALMSMTGLAGPKTAPKAVPTGFAPRGPFRLREGEPRRIAGGRRSGYNIRMRYEGGPIYGKARGGAMRYGWGGPRYMINEAGPENVYSGGGITRNRNPAVIDGKTGYVEPNAKITPEFGPSNYTPPEENPGGVEGGFNFKTDPGYEFRSGEGIRALERSAAARGGLLSGGFARKAIRYGQDYASQEYTNVYNRIANIAGLGQVSAGASGNAAMIAGQQMGNAASNAGFARASGYTAKGNAWANAANEVAKLPWGDVFDGGSTKTNTKSKY